jgi:SAM-dependent methyltransferase
VRFIKTLPVNASLLDAGAGAGSTILFRDWLEPARRDLRMFAWAGERGEFFDRFEVAEVGLWPNDPPRFSGQRFDAVMSVNFIEHIDDPLFFVRFCAERLAPKGRIYLEWPRAESINPPSTAELGAAGVRVMTGRYHDDGTHRLMPPALSDIIGALAKCGLSVVQQGIAEVPTIDQQVALYAR